MTEDFLERMHMADQDDDDADLKQLKQLRQVWLAMPDEEPPTRGLDALMAAARSQATVMEPKPSWWKRMFAAMVRPPALAFATIVVVAGGAVLVSRHRDELDATKSAPTAIEKERAVTVEPPASRDKADEITGTVTGALPEGAPRSANSADQWQGHAGSSSAGPGAAAIVAVPPTKDTQTVAKPVPQVVHAAVPKKSEPKPDAARPPPPAKPNVEASDALEQAKPIVISKPPAAEPTPTATPPKSPTTRGGAPKAGGAQLATDGDAPTNTNMKTESVDSMLRRAREAADRGDCAGARALVGQIAKLDPTYYHNTVVKDLSIAKCSTAAGE